MRSKIQTEVIKLLKNNKVGIISTDTLYGVVGSAFSKKAVEKIYKLKGRDKNKPFIILIKSIKDLEFFGIKPEKETKIILKKHWPEKVSIILPIADKADIKKFRYLHRGSNSLAFRLPKNKWLINLLKKTGPLVAPSANPQGEKPATTIKSAENYFGDSVDFYIDGGKVEGTPSKLIKIVGGKVSVLIK